MTRGTRSKPKQARSALTKERLLAAAIDAFSQGFDAATTRDLARRLGRNLTVITYYFDGKGGLYRAVSAHVRESVAMQLAPMVRNAALAAAASGSDGHSRSTKALFELLDGLSGTSLDLPANAREFIAHLTPAERQALDDVLVSAFEAAAALVARLVRGDGEDPDVRLTTLALLGPFSLWQMNEELFNRLVGTGMNRDDRLAVLQAVRLRHLRTFSRGRVR